MRLKYVTLTILVATTLGIAATWQPLEGQTNPKEDRQAAQVIFDTPDCSKVGMERSQECEPVDYGSSELDDDSLDPNDCTRGIDESNQEACAK